jgi:hypothetical protein
MSAERWFRVFAPAEAGSAQSSLAKASANVNQKASRTSILHRNTRMMRRNTIENDHS